MSNTASSTIEKIALAALQLSQGKSISAARFLGEAAESADILRAVKTILRASDMMESPAQEEPSVVESVAQDADEVSPVEGFVSRHDVEQEMLEAARADSVSELAEAEREEELASEEADDEDDEDANVEVIQARFAKALMNITAAAKKKKRKSSTSVKTGKKIKLTPREI